MRALVTVNYHSHELLDELVPGWGLTDDTQLFVVDNSADNAAHAAISRVGARHGFTVVRAPHNAGFGPGCNLGVRTAVEAGATSVMFVNPDVAIDPVTIAKLFDHVESGISALVSPQLLDASSKVVYTGYATSLRTGATVKPGEPESFTWLTGAVQAMTAQTFAAVGGFDEDYFMYWEDIDFGFRAAARGLSAHVRSDLSAMHIGGATQGSEVKSPLYIEYNCRGRLLFASKNLEPHVAWRWRLLAPLYAAEVIMRSGGRRYLAHIPSLRAAARGTLRGLLGT